MPQKIRNNYLFSSLKIISSFFVFIIFLFINNKKVLAVTYGASTSWQYYTVPANVVQITVKAWGAGGGNGGSCDGGYAGGTGGAGGYASSIINVTPGESLSVAVGNGGGVGHNSYCYDPDSESGYCWGGTCCTGSGGGTAGTGVYGPGGAGCPAGSSSISAGGGGGGAGSFLLRSSSILLAAGGGAGGPGCGGTDNKGGAGGQNGTGNTPGIAGANTSVNGQTGSYSGDADGPGAGGGGYNGGTIGSYWGYGGHSSGGGGGNSYGTTVINGNYTTAGNSGDADRGTAGNVGVAGKLIISPYSYNYAPNAPTLNSPSNGATNQILKPALKATSTDTDSDYLRYKIQLCTDSGMTANCQTFDQTSSQTGWSGQNVSGTAYSSGTQATYTIQSNLTANTTYYWRSYAIDPAGLNTWSSASSIYSFTISANPTAPTNLLTEGQTNPSSISDSTPEFSAIHNDPNGDSANYYEIEVNTSAVFTGTVMWDSGQQSITTIANGARSPDISYAGTGISMNTVYYWRIRFWDTFGLVSPWSNVQTFVFNGPPGIPTINSPVDGAISQPLSPSLKTTAIDPDSDYIRYKILLCTDPDMTLNCQTFDQTASQVGWSGQNDQSNTAFLSGSMATYSLQTTLALNSVYYWKSVGIDPGGSNTWGSTQPSPASFRTVAIPYLYNGCLIEESNHDNYLKVKWVGDNNPNVEGYLVQKSVDSEAFSTVSSVGVGITAYTDNAIARGHTYQYRVIPYYTGPFYGKQCTTATLNLQSSGLIMEGIIFGN